MKIGVCVGVLMGVCGLAMGQGPVDSCGSAQPTPDGSYAFNLDLATPDGSASCAPTSGAQDMWVRYVAAGTGLATFSLCGSSFDTVMSVFSECGGAQLACNDDAADGSCGTQSKVIMAVTAGTPYLIRIAGYAGDTGPGVIAISGPPAPAPDTFIEGTTTPGDAGGLPGDAALASGSGALNNIYGSMASSSDVDLYRIWICQPGQFSATTTNAQTDMDTRLWLLRTDGHGITFNDDNPAATDLTSRLSSTFTASLPPGEYLLAIALFSVSPVDAQGALLWLDAPATVERAPDGPGSANALASWIDDGFEFGSYRIQLSGACWIGQDLCPADMDDGSGTGTPDGAVTIDDLLYVLGMYDGGDVRADLDDGSGTGTRDQAVTIDDLLFFLAHYEGGC